MTGPQQVVFVTGPSGAGRTTALRALEDLGHEAIDNLPLTLLPALFSGEAAGRPLAVGVDARTRGFSAPGLIALLDGLAREGRVRPTLLYLDCADAALMRRFSETRRRHPLAPEEGAGAGVARERELLRLLRDRADLIIDTSDHTPRDLVAELMRRFGGRAAPGLAVAIESFSFRRGTPGGLDLMFDVRFLSNPYWTPDLRPCDGRDPEVAAHVLGDPRFEGFFSRLIDMILYLLPAYREEGKAYLSVGLGCTGGQHRSVFVAEATAKRLEQSGWPVSIRHRELERMGRGVAAREGM